MKKTLPSLKPAAPLPPRPRLVLRAGFAGRKDLTSAEATRLETALADVLHALGHRLAAIAPGVPVEAGKEPRVSAFFQAQAPLLRLVTGLCEGADAVAAQVLERVHVPPDAGVACGPGTPCLETELGAVLPFDVETYRRSRPETFRPEFDRQLARCAWVLALDAHYDKPTEAELAAIAEADARQQRSTLADLRRARGYRAQSAFLLRQSDLLIAAADPTAPGKAGGTLETVREAQIFELPVVFIHTGTGAVHLIEPGDDLHSVLAMPPPPGWQETLKRWVNQITTDPDRDLAPGELMHDEQRQSGESLLAEYFDRPESPAAQAGKRMVRFRKWAWERFEKCFRTGPEPKSDPKLEPYAAWRSRATELNYHYSGLYRGAFLLNYAFAIFAVALATVSLALLGKTAHPVVAGEISDLAGAALNAGATPTPPASGGGLLPVLFALAAVKLGVLFFISRNTTRANKERWNDRAVDLRYLAERLRAMYYLPRLGTQQPPAAAPPQFASRVVRQSAMDWLFDSIARAVSPADLPDARPLQTPTHDGSGTLTVKKLLTFDARVEVERIRDAWIAEQTRYHERNARTHHALHHAAETVGQWLGRAVIVIVSFDVLFIIAEVLEKMHALPRALAPWVPALAPAIPWLVVLTALLPAIVAALGGIRFQSECQRLAERSAVMRVMLGGRVPGHYEKEPTASWPKLWWKVVRFFKNTWLVLRHLFARPSVPPETPLTGGRWQEARDLAARIATARDDGETDPAAWSHDALRLAERTAGDFVQEVAEWSVLYAKEVAEPG
jgi:hypothetical protein